MNLSVYATVAELQGAMPWGSVLDAGTGRGSMRWMLSLQTTRWTAVTGSRRMAEATRNEIGDRQRPQDQLVVGNWVDGELLAGEVYDTVLADYLLGAVDGFAPYWQDRLFARLKSHVGKRLYVVGLEPYVLQSPGDPAGRVINEIGRLRDACLLLSRDRPYREYPLDYVLRHLVLAGFKVLDAQTLPIRYGERFINSQIDLCLESIGRMQDRSPAASLLMHAAGVRERALALSAAEGGLRYGNDYIVVAESQSR